MNYYNNCKHLMMYGYIYTRTGMLPWTNKCMQGFETKWIFPILVKSYNIRLVKLNIWGQHIFKMYATYFLISSASLRLMPGWRLRGSAEPLQPWTDRPKKDRCKIIRWLNRKKRSEINQRMITDRSQTCVKNVRTLGVVCGCARGCRGGGEGRRARQFPVC